MSGPAARPLVWHLAVQGLALALMVLALAAGLGWSYVAAERDRLLRLGDEAAATAAAALDRELGGLQDAVGVLALARVLQAGDPAGFDALARQVRDLLGVNVVLRDLDGQQLVNTRLPPGAPLPRNRDLASDTAVLATGRPQISDLLTGAVARAPVFIVNVPVRRADGSIGYLLNLSPSPDLIRDLLRRVPAPPGWRLEVVDGAGAQVAGLGNGAAAGSRLPPRLGALLAGAPQGRWTTADTPGRIGAWRRSEVSAWTVLASAEAEVVAAPTRRVLATWAGLSLVLAVLSLGLAWAFARRLAAPLERLAEAAATGAPAPPTGRAVREVAALAAALGGVAAAARTRGEELSAVLEATSDGVFALDPGWRLTFMNRCAMDMIAGGRDLTGQVVWDAFPDAVGGALWDAYRRCMDSRAPAEAEEHYAPLGRTYAARAFPAAGGGITVFFRDVTAEREAAARLAESEARLRAILDNVPVGVVLAEAPSGRVVLGNRRIEEILRHPVLPSADVAAYTEWEAYHPDGRRLAARDYPGARALAGEEAPALDVRYRRGDGSLAWIRITAAPVRAPGGAVTGAVAALLDVDAERRATAGLAESEARLRTILDTAPVITWLTDAEGQCYFLNRAWYATTGQAEAESLGLGWTLATHPEDRARAGAAFLEAVRARAEFRVEYRLRRADGTHLWAIDAARPRFAPDGAFLGHVGAVFPVDDLKATEARLAESERRLRREAERVQLALSAGAIIGTWDWDLGADAFTVDERFAQAFGLDPALGREGLPLAQVIAGVHPQDVAGLRAAIDEAIARGGAYSHQYRVKDRDGVWRWIEANGRVDHAADGTPLRFPGVLLDIGARRAAEEERDRATALLRTFIEAVPGVVYAKDREGRILVANEGTALLVGRPLAEILGRTDAEFLDDAAQAAVVMANDRRVMETGLPEQVEETVSLPDGTPATWLSTKAPLRDATGAVIGLIGSSVDISARKAVEAALARREAQIRATHDAAPVGLALVDRALRFLEVNDRMAAINGQPAAAHAGRTPSDLLPPALAAGVEAIYRRVLEGGAPVLDVEFRAEMPAGSGLMRDWLAGYVPVRDGAGAVAGVGCAVQDVTAQKAAERAAREGEERWRGLVEALPQLVWTCTPDGACDYLSPRWEAYTGVPAARQLGHRWIGAVHADDRGRLLAAWRAALAGDAPFDLEARLRGADGAYRWFKKRAVPLRDAAGAVRQWFGTSTDVTDAVAAREVLARAAAELEQLAEQRGRALAESEARLAQAAKMEALGRLAGGVAHDFNNVLQAVQGGVTLAAKRLPRDLEGARRFLALAQEAAGRGAAVTGRLLSFARRGELKAEPLAPAPLLAGLADMLRHTLGPEVALRVEVPPGTPPLLADRGQLEAVLVNLANNARDAMPEGGALVLRAEGCALPADAISAAAPPELGPGGWVRLSVVDAGKGMPPEVLARVTEPFFTTKPPGQGTGLGLAMARGFAEQSGGALTIASAPGRGTTVALWLPEAAAEPGAGAPQDAAPPAAPGTPRGAAVLLVEDEAAVRSVLAAELADRGYGVTEAADGPAALALLEAGLCPDAMVTDLSMPGGLDGLALAAAARERRERLPVVLVTGHAGDAPLDAIAAAERGGPFALLRKPVSAETLADRLALVLRRATPG